MRALLLVACLLVVPCTQAEVGRCLKGWGVVAGLSEPALNNILLEGLIRRVPARRRTLNLAHNDTDPMGLECGFIFEEGRLPCGGSSQEECENSGCCWDDNTASDDLKCYHKECKPGYFGWSCRFPCNCSDRRPCNRTTGECPTGCPDSNWGPGCVLDNGCAYNDLKYEHYMGGKTQTVRGHMCGDWKLQRAYPGDQFPDGSLEAARNYCRNPKPLDYRTWCYYWVDGEKDWDYCTLDKCECPVGRYGVNCEHECHCADTSEACHQVDGSCDSACDRHWTDSDCQAWFPMTVALENAVLSDVEIRAQSASMRVAKLKLTFSSGNARVSAGGRSAAQPLANKYITFRVSVNSFRTTVTLQQKQRYSMHLVIKDENAIMSGIEFPQLNYDQKQRLENGLTGILKQALQQNSRYKLVEFDIPIPRPNELSSVKELIPRDIDYTFYYAAPRSSANAFGILLSPPNTNAKENDEARRFNAGELVPGGADFALHIDSQAFMSFVYHAISKQSIFEGRGHQLYVTDTCPAKVQSMSAFPIRVSGHDIQLETFEVTRHNSSEFNVYIRVKKSRIAAGVDLKAWADVRFRLSYDSYTQTFKPIKTYGKQGHKLYKKWWSHALNVLSLGLFHGIVDILADNFIDGKIVQAVSINVKGAEMPMNVGGVVGDIIDRIHFSNSQMNDQGNMVFELRLAL